MSGSGSIPNPDYQDIYILANLWQQMLHLFKPILPIPRSTSYNHKARKNCFRPYLNLVKTIALMVYHFTWTKVFWGFNDDSIDILKKVWFDGA